MGRMDHEPQESSRPTIIAMVYTRQTDSFTPLSYLDLVQRGGTEDWKTLYAACRDPEVARLVAQTLSARDPELMASAKLWKFLLEDLHPNLGLEIDLHEQGRG